MPPNVAIFYESFAYNTRGQKLMGAQSASEGFLKSYARYSGVDRFHCLTSEASAYENFRKAVARWAPTPAAPISISHSPLRRCIFSSLCVTGGGAAWR